MAMSLAGIVFGVAFFVLTQAQTNGFESFYVRTILGTSGAIQVHDRFQDTLRSMDIQGDEASGFRIAHREARQYIEGVGEPEAVREALLEFENIAGVSEVVEGSARLQTTFRGESIQVYGVRLEDQLNVSDLLSQITVGRLDDFRHNPQGALIGSILARRMQLQVGDTFRLNTAEQVRRYRVAAIYETGVQDIDRVRVYLHLPEARSLLKRPFGASFLQVGVHDPSRAARDAERIESVVGHFAYGWQERERAWLEVFRALKISSAITVSTIIFISGLGMFNTLAMMVMEKTREIAILRSGGFERGSVTQIFLWQGGIVLTFGVLLGWLVGALLTFAVGKIPIRIRGIFATDYFIVDWSVSHYLWAAAVTAVVVAVAAWVPARRAARLEPGDIIRNSAS